MNDRKQSSTFFMAHSVEPIGPDIWYTFGRGTLSDLGD